MLLSYFAHETEVEKFPRGTVIFDEGDQGELLYIVRKGSVEIKVGSTVLEIVRTGGGFGELSLINHHQSRSASATALEDCELIAIDKRRFDRAIQINPFLAREIMTIMADRLVRMDERLRNS